MARTIDAFPHRRATAKYPWDEWLDGRIWELKRGEDFQSLHSVRSSAYVRARDRGLWARVRIVDEDTVVIQAAKE